MLAYPCPKWPSPDMLFDAVHSCIGRKDRRVFEAYQREARAARDKKDKEEIEALRNEVSRFYTYQATLCICT